MNIVREFEHVSLNITGSFDEPLFDADQIGKLLEIVDVRDAIKDFDKDDVVLADDNSDERQNAIFLTQIGVHRLLGASRKPIARAFQKWVANVVIEIISAGRHKMLIEEYARKDEEYARKDEAYARKEKVMKHNVLLSAYADTPLVYLFEVRTLDDGRTVYKFGETDNISEFEPYLKKEYGKGIALVGVYPCVCPYKYEQWLKPQPFFTSHKYDGQLVSARRKHDELLAIGPDELETLTRMMENHQDMFDGWSPAQELQKMRLENEKMRLEIGNNLPNILAAISDPACRLELEKKIVSSLFGRKKEENDNGEHVDEEVGERKDDDNTGDKENGVVESVAEEVQQSAIAPPSMRAGSTASSASQPSSTFVLFAPKVTKLGRIPKPRPERRVDETTPLDQFLDECFTMDDPDALTHVSYVKYRYALWRESHVDRKGNEAMVDFFQKHFRKVQVFDENVKVKCSMYKGLAMKPWNPSIEDDENDLAKFVQERCDLHVMGRASTNDIVQEYVAWMREADEAYVAPKDIRARIIAGLSPPFVYYTGVALMHDGKGVPGIYGFYLKSASDETREVGYNKSPNTRCEVIKLDANMTIVDTLDSQDVLAKNLRVSAQYVCTQLKKAFENGMMPYVTKDGFGYMRKKDYEVWRDE